MMMGSNTAVLFFVIWAVVLAAGAANPRNTVGIAGAGTTTMLVMETGTVTIPLTTVTAITGVL